MGILGFDPSCTGAGYLEKPLNLGLSLTFLTVIQKYDNPASQTHGVTPRTRKKNGCKDTIRIFPITAYVLKKEMLRMECMEGKSTLCLKGPVSIFWKWAIRIYFSELLATGNRCNSFSPTWYGQSNKNATGFFIFFKQAFPKQFYINGSETRSRDEGAEVERWNPTNESCMGHRQRMTKPWLTAS